MALREDHATYSREQFAWVRRRWLRLFGINPLYHTNPALDTDEDSVTVITGEARRQLERWEPTTHVGTSARGLMLRPAWRCRECGVVLTRWGLLKHHNCDTLSDKADLLLERMDPPDGVERRGDVDARRVREGDASE